MQRLTAKADADAHSIRTQAEIASLRQAEQAAQAYSSHPALLRLRELEAMKELGRSANARIYVGFRRYDGVPESDD